jgi:heptosyltransferase II
VSVGIFLPNWLGDLVMATPTLRALRRHFGPQQRLVGIVRPHLAEVLTGAGWLDEQWLFDPRGSDPQVRRLALVRRMRQERFEKLLLLTNSLHTALLAWLGGAKERIGYARDARTWLLTHRLYPQRTSHGKIAPAPMVETYLALAAAVGCPAESPRLELVVTPAEEQLADTVWHTFGLQADRVIALNSSGAYGAAKLWPVEHFAALGRRIVDELGYDVLVVCGPQERDIARAIVAQSGSPRVFSLADAPVGIPLSKACLRRCVLAVSTDSGPRHIAAAFGRPVITLLGPTRPIWIENPTVRGVNLQLDLPCSGCYQRTCPEGHHRCMRELSVEMVFDAVQQMITSFPRSSVAAHCTTLGVDAIIPPNHDDAERRPIVFPRRAWEQVSTTNR